MKHIYSTLLLLGITSSMPVASQVRISIDAEKTRTYSPYVFGKNSGVSDDAFDDGGIASDAGLITFKEAGLKFTRQNHGNNLTKYNWRKKISSHPDWYNNVYSCDWENAANVIDELNGVQSMYGFQLSGYAADNSSHNFSDWDFNKSKWWNGCNQNLAGGGIVNEAGGSKALKDGDYRLYLTAWDEDSTTSILDHWILDLGYDMDNHFTYWSMDNEPEIWGGTHDDLPLTFKADEFIEKYIKVAKKARARYPDIKLCGPVTANEWQWFKWGSETLKIDGRYACWLEYFIKRIAEEQKASGMRLLDVFDLHWYPEEMSREELLQIHRIFYDENYEYPQANGLKTIKGGWDESSNKEFIFKRVNDWLDTYFGEGHGITLALTETAIPSDNPTDIALVYASILGTFMENDVEIFTPWTWKTGMWETVHLFSRYSKELMAETTSPDNTLLSAYTTVNTGKDSMTIILVNRSKEEKSALIDISNMKLEDGLYHTLSLSNLPEDETFVSHTENALKEGEATLFNNSVSISVPASSITAIMLSDKASTNISTPLPEPNISIYPNPTSGVFTINTDICDINRISIFNGLGQITYEGTETCIDASSWATGIYIVKIYTNSGVYTKCFSKD